LENEVKDDLIDGDHVLTGIILHHTSDKSLREEKARDPEMIWGTVVNPVLNELDTMVQIINPRTQWLQ
jgi:hypothetical protein